LEQNTSGGLALRFENNFNYGEYGLSDRLTFIAYVPYKRLALNRQIGNSSGFVFFRAIRLPVFPLKSFCP